MKFLGLLNPFLHMLVLNLSWRWKTVVGNHKVLGTCQLCDVALGQSSCYRWLAFSARVQFGHDVTCSVGPMPPPPPNTLSLSRSLDLSISRSLDLSISLSRSLDLSILACYVENKLRSPTAPCYNLSYIGGCGRFPFGLVVHVRACNRSTLIYEAFCLTTFMVCWLLNVW